MPGIRRLPDAASRMIEGSANAGVLPVHQVGCRLCHAPGAAGGAKPAPLGAECHQLVVAAVAAAQSQEAVREDAAFEEGVELVLDELRQAGPGLSLREEGCGVLLHQVVQRGLFRAVSLVVD